MAVMILMRQSGLQVSLAGLLLLLGGCSQMAFPVNHRLYEQPLEPVQELHAQDADDVLMVVTFSGGGTRAAALAYGVLEVLKETPGSDDGKRLLDEIDLISGVSGGSFAAAYYGLYGDTMFDRFVSEFLNKDVQGAVIWELFKPWNWPRLASPLYGRSELAADWLDNHYLYRASIAELLDGNGPRVHLNATDLSRGSSFAFTPEQFGFLCSDLNSVPISRAVAASSAVPLVTSSVAIRNYANYCEGSEPEWVDKVLTKGSYFSRDYHEAVRIRSYADSTERPWIHLVDGGLSDNLGLRSVINYLGLDSEEVSDDPPATRKARKMVFIVVNAETRPDIVIDRSPVAPSTREVLKSSTDVPINRYNYESILLLRQRMLRWERLRREECAQSEADCSDIDSYLVEVKFDAVQGSSLREFLFRVPTTLSLPPEVVSQIRGAASELLLRSPDYRRLIDDLAADQDSAGPPAR